MLRLAMAGRKTNRFMAKLIFDIETVGENFDELDETTQEALTRWIKKDSSSEEEYQVSLEDLKSGLGFSPLTGQIVVIGVLDADKNQGAVYFQAPGQKIEEFEENGIKYKTMTEKEMLEKFWELAKKYDEFISFNGRGFDAPFMMIRSAIHKIKPSRNLMDGRYLYQQKSAVHVDLQDQLCFYGSVRRKGSLHLYSRAFGIKSPKAGGISGDEVGPMFKAGKFKEIARYNAGDLFATGELYNYWNNYLK